MANAFETKCSIRNKPMGTIPVSECRRRRKKECPWPARSGATPFLISTGDELTVEATNHYILERIAYIAAMRQFTLIERILLAVAISTRDGCRYHSISTDQVLSAEYLLILHLPLRRVAHAAAFD